MPHGYPDWGRDDAQELLYGLPDMSELAARLWSPNTFNRHGHMIFMDGFEGSLNKWDTLLDGLGAAAGISSERARNGLVSCHLVGGSDGNGFAEIWHHEPYPVLSSFGLEVSFSYDTANLAFDISLHVTDAVQVAHYRVRWLQPTNDLEYWDNAGAWQPLALGVDLEGEATQFHTMKLVIDSVNQLYRYLIVDNVVYPMAGIPAELVGPVLPPSLNVWIVQYSRPGNNDEAWVDDVILTQHEP